MQPQALLARISLAKNRLQTAEDVPGRGRRAARTSSSARSGSATASTSRASARSTSTTCCSRRCACCASTSEVREHYARRYRHVLVDEYQDTNGPQYEIVRADRRRAPQRVRRRRRRPVDLRLARRRHPQDPELPPRLPRRQGRPPADQLPLHAQQILDAANSGDPPQRLAPREEARGRARQRRAGAAAAAQGRDLRGAATWRRRSSGCVRRSRRAPGRLRDPVPHAGAVPAVRGGAARGRAALHGRRRHVVLRPQGGARRPRLPEAGARTRATRSRCCA